MGDLPGFSPTLGWSRHWVPSQKSSVDVTKMLVAHPPSGATMQPSNWPQRQHLSNFLSVLAFPSSRSWRVPTSLKSQFVPSFQKIFWPRWPPWLWVDLGLFLCPKKFRPQQLLIFLKFMLPFWNFVKFLKCCIQFYILWNFWNFYPVLKICRNLVNIWNFVPCFEILWNFWNFVPRFEIFVKYLEQTSVLRGLGWSMAQGTAGQKAMVEELGI